MVDEQQNIIAAFTEMAPRYERLMNDELNKFWGIDYPVFVRQLLSGLQSTDRHLILDVATGTSYIPLFLSSNLIPFKKIIGLDITYGMLAEGKRLLSAENISELVPQVSASALEMPFAAGIYDVVICCLATHHMEVNLLLENIIHVLKPGGKVLLADAGGSSAWKNSLVKGFIKIAAFFYFLFQENFSRAKAEMSAIGNIHSFEKWEEMMRLSGFSCIELTKMKSKKFWAPDPLIIRALKP
ncbi:MAG: class I SAM-dependent methyltransferase [Chloroflexi bacterium]|nr:class I SAM-dependent methyltransferase [Chloroflexota bacterium]